MKRLSILFAFVFVCVLVPATVQGGPSSSLYNELFSRLSHLKERIFQLSGGGQNVDQLQVCARLECLPVNSTCDPFDSGIPCICQRCLDQADSCFKEVANLTNDDSQNNITSTFGCNCFKALKSCIRDTQNERCLGLPILFQENCKNATNTSVTTGGNETCDCDVEFDQDLGFSNLVLRTCSMNAYCDPVERQCSEFKGEGEICRDQTLGPFEVHECGNSQRPFITQWETSCENGVCRRAHFANVTDGCDSNEDCFLSDLGRVQCRQGICRGVNENDTCEFSAECEFGLYCASSNKTCTRQARAGSVCDPEEDEPCLPWLMCGLNQDRENECVRKINSTEGFPCANTEQCELGHFCWNNTCHRAPDTLESCIVDSDCEDGFVCRCDGLEGRMKCFPEDGLFGQFLIDASCQRAYEIALQCAQDNVCKNPLSTDLQSCTIRNCFREVSCAILCAGTTTLRPLIESGCLVLPDILNCPRTLQEE